MKIIFLFLLLASNLSFSGEVKWNKLDLGLDEAEGSIEYKDKEYSIKLVRVDAKYYNAKIVGMHNYFSNLKDADAVGASWIAMKEGVEYRQFSPHTIKSYIEEEKGNESIISSIGYLFSDGESTPLGLLRLKNDNVSTYSEIKYLSAVLCILNRDENFSVAAMYTRKKFLEKDSNVSELEVNKCSSAIQVGPRIVERYYERGIKKGSLSQSEERVIFSIGKDRKIYLSYWKDVPLYVAQEILLSGKLGAGTKSLYAVNISIRELSGFFVKDSQKKTTTTGNVDTIIPAILVFTKKSNN